MPNQSIDLNSYDPDISKIQRQQRLADMLQQQTMDAVPVNSYNGVQAPISPFSVLAKALQGYAAKKYQDKADQGAIDYRNRDLASSQALARQLTENRAPIAPVTSQLDPSTPTLPGQAPQPAQPPVSMTSPGQAGGMPSSQEQMAMLLSAHGGPQTQMIQNTMLPQIMNRQNLDYQHQLGREDKTWENAQPMPIAMGQQIAAQGAQTQANAVAANKLPQTANERAVTGLGYAQLNKPVSVPFMGNMWDPKTRTVFTPGGAAGSQPDAADPNSKSLTAATGLSQLAIDRLTGAPNQPRTAAIVMKVDKEIQDYARNNNVDMSTLRARATGINNVVTQNTMRNNQANILEKEISGSVDNLGPLLDQMHAGKINKANVFGIWAGRQTNDQTALQAADQLGRFRNELAGYNAVAGGHLMENGTPAPTPADFMQADKIISDGIDAGGARGVSNSVGMSANKNRTVLANSVQDAQSQLWDAFGKGDQFKRTHATAPVGGSGGNALSADDQQALNWANANPKDPRAAQIKQHLGR